MIMIYFFIVFACIGSFVNVLIYRLPKSEDIVFKRSYCPHCQHVLGVNDLIPVVSYIALRGECRYCGKKISLMYPVIELLSGCIGIICIYRYGFNIEMILNFFVIEILICLSIIDFRYEIIPDECNFIIFILAFVKIFYYDLNLYAHIVSAFSVSSFLYFMNVWINNSFGGGDIKLMFSIGLYLGLKLNLLSFVLAVLIAGSYATYLLIFKKVNRKSILAFGPFLSIGIIMSLTYGNNIVEWYKTMLKY